MRLPTPTAEDVERFRAIYARTTGKTLNDAEAHQAATYMLTFIYLTHYAIHSIQSEE